MVLSVENVLNVKGILNLSQEQDYRHNTVIALIVTMRVTKIRFGHKINLIMHKALASKWSMKNL